MTDDTKIFPCQAALYVDVQCYRCQRTVAMPNTVEFDGRRYCSSCNEHVLEERRSAVPGVVVIMGEALHNMKNAMAEDLFGMTVEQAISGGICIQCREPADPNCYSKAGKDEWKTSGLCERCFDAMFEDADA